MTTMSEPGPDAEPEASSLPTIEELAQTHARSLWLFCKYLTNTGIQVAMAGALLKELADEITYIDTRALLDDVLQSIGPEAISQLHPVDQAEQIIEACVNEVVCLDMLTEPAELLNDGAHTDAQAVIPREIIPTEELIDHLLAHFHLQMPNLI